MLTVSDRLVKNDPGPLAMRLNYRPRVFVQLEVILQPDEQPDIHDPETLLTIRPC